METLFDAPGNHLCGVALDPANNRIYWANFSTDEIRRGNLDGSGASTLFTDPAEAPRAGWRSTPRAAGSTGPTSSQTRSGSGTWTARCRLDPVRPRRHRSTAEPNPIGVAVDPAAGKVYWTDLGGGRVRVGNLNGTGASTLFGDESSPGGLAIDPGANEIYWGNFGAA